MGGWSQHWDHKSLDLGTFGCTKPNQTAEDLIKLWRHRGSIMEIKFWLIHFRIWPVAPWKSLEAKSSWINLWNSTSNNLGVFSWLPSRLSFEFCCKLARPTGVLCHDVVLDVGTQACGAFAHVPGERGQFILEVVYGTLHLVGKMWERWKQLECWQDIVKKGEAVETDDVPTLFFSSRSFPAGVFLAVRFKIRLDQRHLMPHLQHRWYFKPWVGSWHGRQWIKQLRNKFSIIWYPLWSLCWAQPTPGCQRA